jgi:hypothetical protein
LAASGADIKTNQEFSGHETLTMVLHYARAQSHVVDKALDKLEQGTANEREVPAAVVKC